MTTRRIIGKIDLKGTNVIKGKRFEGLRVIDSLDKFLKERSNEEIVDEIYLNNITGSLYETDFKLDLLKEVCDFVDIPITVQGGIKNLSQIENLFRHGASRVALNTAILNNQVSIKELVNEFGSQAIVFSPSIRISNDHKPTFYINAGREIAFTVYKSPYEYINSLIDDGLIELSIRLIDFDGVNIDIDFKIIECIKKFAALNIDVIVSGSMHLEGNYENILNAGCRGISLSSMYIYDYQNIGNLRKKLSEKFEVRI